jgi:hypothetical protein
MAGGGRHRAAVCGRDIKRYISARVPLNTMVAAVSEDARNALVAEVTAALRPDEDAHGLALPTAVNVVTAYA